MPKKKNPISTKKKRVSRVSSASVTGSFFPRVVGFVKNPWGLAIVIAVAVIGIWAVFSSRAATTATCGATVSNYNYQVPFGKAIWNQPICGLPRHPQSADYASRLFNWGNLNDGTPADSQKKGKIDANPGYPDTQAVNPYGNLFTREVYYASKATTEARIATTAYYSNLDGANVNTFTPNATIPWNPSWETGQGGDNEMVILDDRPGPTQGRVYTLSGYWASQPGFPQRKIPPVACYAAWQQNRLCTYDTSVGRDINGNYIDYRTYEGFIKDRGVGLPYLATLTLPEEVEAGEIRHALGISIPNTAYGPVCQKSQLGNWNQEGKTCGTAVAPASKFEWASKTAPAFMPEPYKSIYTLDKTIPEGMRFGLDMTYDQIENWIKSRADLTSNPRRANTARIFARAMKDYGMLVADTSGYGISLQLAGGINPDNAKKWTALGMGPNEKNNLLDGLLTANNIYVVDPPVATCADGTRSKYFCDWLKVQYAASSSATTSTPSPSPTPSVTSPISPTTTVKPTTTSTPSPNPTTSAASNPAAKTSPTPSPTPAPVADKTAPSAPTAVTRALAIDPTRFSYNLEIKWRASTDAGSGVKDYLITRGDGKTWTSVSPVVVDNTIVANTLYSYEIKARDNAGNVSAAATTSAKGSCLLIWCWLE